MSEYDKNGNFVIEYNSETDPSAETVGEVIKRITEERIKENFIIGI